VLQALVSGLTAAELFFESHACFYKLLSDHWEGSTAYGIVKMLLYIILDADLVSLMLPDNLMYTY
jgi:hypothetical protein